MSLALLALASVGCSASDLRALSGDRALYQGTDSMGVRPKPVLITLQARPQLVENSAATLSHTQPGVWFTVNDSGNEPLLFALDTTGADRGMWRVRGTTNVDWEAASVGPCTSGGAAAQPAGSAAGECVYIGDVGDNQAQRKSRVIYQLAEPAAQAAGYYGSVEAKALRYRYSDGPHDVEAMYVAPNGDTYLLTKRRLLDANRVARPSLVFQLPKSYWGADSTVVAQLVDSLPIVPGSAPMRYVTDAALSPDGHHLAVRTYAQVYVFATDSITGRVRGAIPPAVCNIVGTERSPGEGVAWYGRTGKLMLTAEGRSTPLVVVDCPMPRGEP